MAQVDTFVGRKIRERRVELGKSQADLAGAIGVRFQQIQKYETGVNRVSASRLWAIAEELQVPIEFFFQGVVATGSGGARAKVQADWISTDARSLRLIRDFQTLPEPQKRALLAIVKSMAGDAQEIMAERSSEGA